MCRAAARDGWLLITLALEDCNLEPVFRFLKLASRSTGLPRVKYLRLALRILR
jgi:hypothetical protein